MTHDQTNDFRAQSTSIAQQIWTAVREKDLSSLAKEVAYNILFAMAPLLIFVTALAGWVTQMVNSELANPAKPVLDWMTDTLPAEAANFLREPVEKALQTDPGFLLSFGAILALWGAKSAMSAIIKGLNTAYGIEADSRSWLVQTGVAVGLTIALALMLGVAGVIFVLGTDLGQDIADAIGLGGVYGAASTWLRWPVIVLVAILAVAFIHKFGPNVDADLKWFLPGAAFTVITTAIATFAIGIYFSIGGGFSEAYGAFGAVLAFIFWLYIMSLLMLVGGVINMAVQKEIPSARQNIDERMTTRNDNDDVLDGEQSGTAGNRAG